MKIPTKQARKPRSYASFKLCPLTRSLTGVRCRAASVAKNYTNAATDASDKYEVWVSSSSSWWKEEISTENIIFGIIIITIIITVITIIIMAYQQNSKQN